MNTATAAIDANDDTQIILTLAATDVIPDVNTVTEAYTPGAGDFTDAVGNPDVATTEITNNVSGGSTNTASADDATLTMLALSGAGGAPLNETFAVAPIKYTASVGNNMYDIFNT